MESEAQVKPGTPSHYCQHKDTTRRGLTCLERDLQLVCALPTTDTETYKNRETIHRCQVCQGLYKHVHTSVYETRNFDCEEGWWDPCYRYFKVGEIYGTGAPLPIPEARNYGYVSGYLEHLK